MWLVLAGYRAYHRYVEATGDENLSAVRQDLP